ncbi:MAG: DUF5667 domain-containing protein, partial [bacterium]
MNFNAWLRPVAITAAFIFAVMAGGGATALASQSALPDSPLYRLKLASEDVRVWFTFSETAKADVLVGQSHERTEEIQALSEQGKLIPANVLSALRNRNERAAEILDKHPEEAELQTKLEAQAADQEDLLVALRINIKRSALDEYVAAIVSVHNVRLPGSDEFVSIRPEEISEGIQVFTGPAQRVSDDVWNIGGVEVLIDGATIGQAEIQRQPGATVRIQVGKNSRGDLRALSVTALITGTPTGSVVSGEVEQITNEGVTIAGQFIPLKPETLRSLKIK